MHWILLIMFFAALLQGVTGFGFALVAMPLLAFLLDAPSAAALVALLGVVLSAVIAVQNWKDVHFGEVSGLILSAAIGVPFGVYVLANAPQGALLIALGTVIIAFSLFSLLRPPTKELKDSRWRFAAGFAGGVLGGAYNIPGPPVIFYGALRRWEPARYLGVTQAFFFPVSIMIASGHAVAGFWSREILTLFVFCLPGVIVASFIGRRVATRLSPETLAKAIYGLCLALGLVIVVTNIGA